MSRMSYRDEIYGVMDSFNAGDMADEYEDIKTEVLQIIVKLESDARQLLSLIENAKEGAEELTKNLY